MDGIVKRIVIGLNLFPYEDVVEIRIDTEGAEYIAKVMEQEFERTADGGAFDIANKIRRAFA